MPSFQSRTAAQMRRPWCLLALTWMACGALVSAHADDRPFLRTTHAMASDDDDAWEVNSTMVANRRGQALGIQLEHELTPMQRLELEWGASTQESAPEPEQGVRLRSLWLSPETHGWGFATKLGLEPRRDHAVGGDRWQAMGVWSLPLLQARWWVHANVGWQWQRHNGDAPSRTQISSWATHFVVNPDQWLYAENASASDGREGLLHVGWRQWLMHHQLALDVGGGRLRAPAHSGEFIAVNLSFFDLNF